MNETLANLVAWSLHYAAMGIYPDRGFYNEEFGKNTYRAHLRGKAIAEDFKPFDLYFKVGNQNMLRLFRMSDRTFKR